MGICNYIQVHRLHGALSLYIAYSAKPQQVPLCLPMAAGRISCDRWGRGVEGVRGEEADRYFGTDVA